MIEKNRVIAVIPARAGSKSVIDKNIQFLAGKPLLAWSIDTAKLSKYIDRIIVSTDGDAISKVAQKYGAEVYARPQHLAQDDSIVIDCLRDIISKLKVEGEQATYLVLLQPTSPLRNVEDIDIVIEKLLTHDSVATFCEAELNPHRAWKINSNSVEPFVEGAIPWLPRQKLPKAHQLNGAVYGFRIDKLPNDGVALLFGTLGAVTMPHDRSVDIDNKIDFVIAEAIIKGMKND